MFLCILRACPETSRLFFCQGFWCLAWRSTLSEARRGCKGFGVNSIRWGFHASWINQIWIDMRWYGQTNIVFRNSGGKNTHILFGRHRIISTLLYCMLDSNLLDSLKKWRRVFVEWAPWKMRIQEGFFLPWGDPLPYDLWAPGLWPPEHLLPFLADGNGAFGGTSTATQGFGRFLHVFAVIIHIDFVGLKCPTVEDFKALRWKIVNKLTPRPRGPFSMLFKSLWG